jgi:outer membrane receptor for ferrienterochelin and colicin
MKKIVPVFALLLPLHLLAQRTFTISGYIQDAASGEKLFSAAAFDKKSSSGVVSNTYGFFSLTLPKGEVDLVFTYVGYEPTEIKFDLKRDTAFNIRMKEHSEIKTVEISAKKQNRIEERTQMSQVTVPIELIKKVPALLGEVDVLKALQLLPGVQAGTEGQNGLYVRGGSPDQNLILLDGVPVYNVSHLGGFFSVFNGDAIKDVTLTKGGFPARFGGRLSSVLEINMKEGNMNSFHGEGGLGLLSSRLTLEGPILKDKVSFMVSARRSYMDVVLRPVISASVAAQNSNNANETTTVDPKLYFYDLNAKVNWKINEQHRIFLSAYNGADIFGFAFTRTAKDNSRSNSTNGGIDFGNLTTALRWNYLINNRLFANTTLTYSRFNVNILTSASNRRDTVVSDNTASLRSGIEDIGFKTDFDYVINPQNHIRFGAGITNHTYSPRTLQLAVQAARFNIDTTLGEGNTKALESALYVEDELKLGLLKLSVGLHFSGFKVDNVTYSSLQPRLGMNYPLSQHLAAKASFVTMRQYINLLTNEGLGLPTDLWVPSTAKVKPQDAWQAALGIAQTIRDEYEFSVEAYYKKMNNVISYTEGASFLNLNGTSWQDRVAQGTGTAYGLELFVQKKEGRLTGWLGYTWSRNFRQFATINKGLEYPFKYDRRHDFKALVAYQISDKWSFSGSWQYGTGNATSLPELIYNTPATTYLYNPNGAITTFGQYGATEIIGEKNAFRMPAYHRLDFSFERKVKKKRYTGAWNFGAYNAYNRANPMFLFLDTQDVYNANGTVTSTNVVRQASIFPIIPSVAYNFKF